MARPPGSVLFVCGENALRSPMAEGIAKHYYGDRVYIDSVGVRAGQLDPMAVGVMAEVDIDISHHQSKRLDDLMDTSFDVVITLTPESHHRAIELTRTSAAEVEFWPMPDPSVFESNREARLAAYRELREILFARIRDRLGEPGIVGP